MVAAFIIGVIAGIGAGIWISHLLMDAYMDYRLDQIFPKKDIVIVADEKKNREVPELLKAIKKIKVQEQLN